MGNIEKNVDKNAQLTIYTAKGSLSGEEVRNAIRDSKAAHKWLAEITS